MAITLLIRNSKVHLTDNALSHSQVELSPLSVRWPIDYLYLSKNPEAWGYFLSALSRQSLSCIVYKPCS